MSETKVPPEFEKFKLGVWVKEIDPSYGSNVRKKYMVSKEPFRFGSGWSIYVAKSLSKKAMNHMRRCDDFDLCDPPNQIPDSKITLTLTREQAERFVADVDCLMPMKFYGAHPAIGELKKQIEEKLK